jgi:hypothetical protein
VGATAITVGAGWWQNHLNDRISARKDQEFRTFRLASETTVADLQNRAAKANQRAQEDRLARVKIEERIAPRRLTTERQASLSELFRTFSGRTVRVASYELDVDGAMLGEQILRAARDAGLSADDKRMSQGALGGMMVGISVTGTDAPMVSAIISLFDAMGLYPSSVEPPPTGGASFGGQGVPFSAKIFLGPKPLPE